MGIFFTPRKLKREAPPLKRALLDFRGRILSGLIVLVPLGITFFILNFLFAVTAGLIVPVLKGLPWATAPPPYVINILSVTILIVILYIVGLIAANMVGKRLIELGEAILARIPLVKTVYSASKQVVDAFSIKDKTSSFRSVALVEFPSKGLRSFGFVTGTVLDECGRLCYRVFIPTTPNPTTGYLLVMKSEDVALTNFSMEEACKIIMSGGIIFPESLAERIVSPEACDLLPGNGSSTQVIPTDGVSVETPPQKRTAAPRRRPQSRSS